MDHIKEVQLAVGSKKFAFFGSLPIPVVEADNDFDRLSEIVRSMMLVVGAVIGRELTPSIYLAKSKYHYPPIDNTKVYSSQEYTIAKTTPKRERPQLPLPAEFYQKIKELSGAYAGFFEEKWHILGPVVQLNLERNPVSNFYSALLNQSFTVPLLYEFLCAVYDEALDEGNQDVIVEVMQLATLQAEIYPHFMGFHDLLGVAHYNRNEYSLAIERWKLAKECLLAMHDEEDGEGEERSAAFVSKIDSMLASAEVKLHFEIGCEMAQSDPDTALKHLKSAKPVFADWWVFNYYSGIAYMAKRNYLKATELFQRTLEMFSGCHEAYERLAEIEESYGHYERAYDYLAHSLQINPKNGEVLGRLIVIADKIGKLDRVAKLLKQAKELDAENVHVKQAESIIQRREKGEEW